jgi:hypothetical protein
MKSEQLYSLKANNRENASPLTKSERKTYERSSGVYGSFAALGSIDKTLKLLEENKRRSIAY